MDSRRWVPIRQRSPFVMGFTFKVRSFMPNIVPFPAMLSLKYVKGLDIE